VEAVTEKLVFESPHCLQVFTEEDGEGGAIYYFDGHFVAEAGHRAAYLLNEDWRLPSGCGEGGFVPTEETEPLEPRRGGAGTTYAVFLERTCKYPLDNLGWPYRIEGVRLAGLAHWLLASTPDYDFPGYLTSLRAPMIAGVSMPDPLENAFLSAVRAEPGDAASWAAWDDWREERGAEPPGVGLLRNAFARLARLNGAVRVVLPLDEACGQLLAQEAEQAARPRAAPKSLIHVEEHLAQICLDVSSTDDPDFAKWILFDDLWASAHPDLANALLRWCGRWDVLSAD